MSKQKFQEETAKTNSVTQEEKGILCPHCRFKTRVYKTKTLTGEVARERICDRCHAKIDTEEKVIA